MKHISLIAICLQAFFLISACAPIPTKDNPAAYTRSYVQDAIRLYNREGRQALTDYYNSPESMDGQWYMFIVDEHNVMFVHHDPEYAGTDFLTITDPTGYRSGEAISKTTEQGQWFTYIAPNYETGQQTRKHAWAIRHDGLIFGSGWYETDSAEPAE